MGVYRLLVLVNARDLVSGVEFMVQGESEKHRDRERERRKERERFRDRHQETERAREKGGVGCVVWELCRRF